MQKRLLIGVTLATTLALLASAQAAAEEPGSVEPPRFPLPIFNVPAQRDSFPLTVDFLPRFGFVRTVRIAETDCWRTGWLVDAAMPRALGAAAAGLSSELYLGQGVSVGCHLEATPLGLYLPVYLHYYPLEGVCLTFRGDLLRRQFHCWGRVDLD